MSWTLVNFRKKQRGNEGALPICLTPEGLCAIAAAAAMVPVWLHPWFATQDGPSHLYNAIVLARYGDPANAVTRGVFEPVLQLFPNWTVFALLAGLARLVGPFVAMKVVVSLCIAAIPAATLYLQKSFKPAADGTALVGAMLAFSHLLFMGFFNFILGCAAFAFTVGFGWRRRDRPAMVRLYLLLAVTYLTHGLAFTAAVMALAVLSAVERRWRGIVVLIPAALVVAIDAWPRLHGSRGYQSLGWHLQRLMTLDSFAYFRAVHANIGSAMSVLMVVAVALSLRRARPRAPIALSAALLALYFTAPWAYTAGGSQLSWINERFLLLFLMTLPAWLDVPRPRLVLVVLTVMTALHLGTTWRDVAALSADTEGFLRCRKSIPDHVVLDVIGEPPRVVTKLQPLLHAPALLAVDRDIAYLPDYEARLDDFPIRFREGAPRPPADFAVVWRGMPSTGSQVCEGAGFRLVRLAP